MVQEKKNGWKEDLNRLSIEVQQRKDDVSEWLQTLDNGTKVWGKNKMPVRSLIKRDQELLVISLTELKKCLKKAAENGLNDLERKKLKGDREYVMETEKFISNIII